jgi:peptide/nickel transport system permease protein
MILGLVTGIIATLISVAIGISAGFLGGLSDELLSLISNVFLVFPALPFLIVVLGAFPKSGELPEIILLAVLGWPWGARVIRAQTLSLRNRDFVAASRETGEKSWRIIFLEILPNEISLIAASFVGTVLYAIGASVGLDFLGVGNTTTWSLGTILYWAQNGNALQLGAWWWFAIPGVCVALIGTGLVLLNFGLDELGNPRLKDAAQQRKINGRTWRPADPTPVIRRSETSSATVSPAMRNGAGFPSAGAGIDAGQPLNGVAHLRGSVSLDQEDARSRTTDPSTSPSRTTQPTRGARSES